jgi:flagellar protein FlaJ
MLHRFIRFLAYKDPKLKYKLAVAHRKDSPYEFIRKIIGATVMFSCFVFIIIFLLTGNLEMPFYQKMLMMVGGFIFSLPLWFRFHYLSLEADIKKREGDINKEVIFAGRFLLIKLDSGIPLFNALIEGSKSYGVSAKYFKEIVDDINLGTPIEEALDNAMKYTPSEKFKKILFQINNALKLGIDVTTSLKSILDELMAEQNAEIKRYGKKLNSVAMFYMMIAIVVPSLGMTMLVVIMSFLSIDIGTFGYTLICVLLSFIQIVFISTFRSIRPNVNI